MALGAKGTVGDERMSREIDAAVAEHVMGYAKRTQPNGHFQLFHPLNGVACTPPNFSTDIAAAKLVTDSLLALEPVIEWSDENQCWLAYFNKHPAAASHEKEEMARCLAALKAKGININDEEI